MSEKTDFSIDGITLDPENKEFKYALECVQYTNQLIYLTGKAGTGKTTFLKYLRKVTSKKMVVLAPTGVAAINAKGQTIHSFFHIPISLFVPDDKRLNEGFYDTFHYRNDTNKMIRNMELLVIDEISMVRCDLLDVVDIILRRIRKSSLPFGGVQVLLIGDTFQLPPVVTKNDWSVLRPFYDSEFFFSARVMNRLKPLYIELKKVYRQKEKDFVDVLNRIRVGKQDATDIQLLNSRVAPSHSTNDANNYIILTTTNEAAGAENKKRLDALSSKSSLFEADIEGDFPLRNYPTNRELELKVGTQVIFIKNNWVKGYFNGKIGIVSEFKKGSIVVNVADEQDDETPIIVEPFTWENIEYKWNDKEKTIEETIKGTFKQYPLKLAWAITVHKSQGMTFEKVIADVSWSFAAGQVYVALSRCTSLNGLILKSRITPQAIKTDPRVIAFAKNEVPETLILEELQKGKADYYYAESRRCLKSGDAEGCFVNFIKAIKYRNDIETNLFKRFVLIWINRYYHKIYKESLLTNDLSILNKEIDKYKSKNKELTEILKNRDESILDYTKKFESLQIKNLKQIETIHDLSDEILTLETAVSEKEVELDVKKEKNISLMNELNKFQEDNETLKSEILTLKNNVENLRNIINNQGLKRTELEIEKNNLTKELERVRNIKWYQKLFGKK